MCNAVGTAKAMDKTADIVRPGTTDTASTRYEMQGKREVRAAASRLVSSLTELIADW